MKKYRELSQTELCEELARATHAVEAAHGTHTQEDIEDIIDEIFRRQLFGDDPDAAPF